MDGWIKLHRSLLDKAFIKDPEKMTLWIAILMLANHKEREEMFKGKPFKCQPGQFTTGRKQLSELTGIDRNKIDRTLKYFEKIEQQIEQQPCSKNRLITIKNWDLYQLQENEEQLNEQQVSNNRATTEHTTRMQERKKRPSRGVNKPSLRAEESNAIWYELVNLWKTEEDPNILNSATRKKYFDKLETEQQQAILDAVKGLGEDVQYLKNVWISVTFKNKNMNEIFLMNEVARIKKSQIKNKITDGTTHNFSGRYK